VVWFLVDDNLAFHKKVITAGNDAMGAWVRAGAWAAFALTDGYVPITVARQIGTKKELENLVKAGLWSRVTDGYQFHDWDHLQPASDQVKQRREAARIRKQRQRERENVTPPVTRDPRARARPMSLKGHGSGRHAGGDEAARPPQTARCPQCENSDGYRTNGIVCDHIDRTQTNANGSAAVREMLNEAKAKRANQ
jgi:hypothetical protein